MWSILKLYRVLDTFLFSLFVHLTSCSFLIIGVFTLISKYNLEYPEFYTKLYQLFTPELLHVKYRARFFHLANIFLSSTHLPAYLVAAFIKRLSRLCLSAPSNTIPMVIRFRVWHEIFRNIQVQFRDPLKGGSLIFKSSFTSCFWMGCFILDHILEYFFLHFQNVPKNSVTNCC